MKSDFCIKNKLHPLLLEVLELINYRINSLSDVKALKIDPQLSEIYGKIKNEDLFIVNEFYQATGFRKLHLEVAKLGKSFQILHCVFFPDPRYELPIFGVDLIISSNNISAGIVDLSPVGEHLPSHLISKMDSLELPQFKETRILPDWAHIFSPYVLFIRPVDMIEEKSFLKTIDKYLSVLLSVVDTASADNINSTATIDRYKYQSRYCLNQKLNDKTRAVLSKFFGASWAEKYIEKILFEC